MIFKYYLNVFILLLSFINCNCFQSLFNICKPINRTYLKLNIQNITSNYNFNTIDLLKDMGTSFACDNKLLFSFARNSLGQNHTFMIGNKSKDIINLRNSYDIIKEMNNISSGIGFANPINIMIKLVNDIITTLVIIFIILLNLLLPD